jgi:hypothetical protein
MAIDITNNARARAEHTVSSPLLSIFFTGLHTEARLKGFFAGGRGALPAAV